MDEVDGRPGALASKSGHLDAPNGVPPLSLSLQTRTVILSESAAADESKDPRLFFLPQGNHPSFRTIKEKP